MSILDKFKLYFGFGNEEPRPPVKYVPTLEEKAAGAAADRGYAFGLVEDAMEALRDSSLAEAEVAAEAQRRAMNGLRVAQETAERILASGKASAERYEEQAAYAQSNALDDSSAVLVLNRLIKEERDDAA